MAKTQRECLIAGLVAEGWKEVPTRTGATFRKFAAPHREGYYGFVTRGGSFRYGKTRASATYQERARAKLIERGRHAEGQALLEDILG